jgi:hypothetical protein
MHAEHTRAVQRATEKEQRLQAEIKCVSSPPIYIHTHISETGMASKSSMLLDSALSASPPLQLPPPPPPPQSTTPTVAHAQLLLSPSSTTTTTTTTTTTLVPTAPGGPTHAHAHTNGHAHSRAPHNNNHPPAADREVSPCPSHQDLTLDSFVCLFTVAPWARIRVQLSSLVFLFLVVLLC